MTHEERERREVAAHAKVAAAGYRATLISLSPPTFLVGFHDSTSARLYRVVRTEDDYVCDCAAGERRYPCRHRAAVLQIVRRLQTIPRFARTAGLLAPPTPTSPAPLPPPQPAPPPPSAAAMDAAVLIKPTTSAPRERLRGIPI